MDIENLTKEEYTKIVTTIEHANDLHDQEDEITRQFMESIDDAKVKRMKKVA